MLVDFYGGPMDGYQLQIDKTLAEYKVPIPTPEVFWAKPDRNPKPQSTRQPYHRYVLGHKGVMTCMIYKGEVYPS